MNLIDACPICKKSQLEKILTKPLSYPEGDLADNLMDINFVRNYILFENILQQRESLEFTYLLCQHCGLIFFSPRPTHEDMAIKYATMDELRDTELRSVHRGSAIYDDVRAGEIYETIRRIKKPHAANVVDIGGATGYNLKYFVPENKCFVVDYGKREMVDGVEYLAQTTNKIKSNLLFDVILCCHTLEHVVDPVVEVMNMKKIMQPNGLLYVEVPLGCHQEWQHTNNYLTHINFYSEGSLRSLFEQCDMTIRSIKTKVTTYRWLRMLSVVLVAENTPVTETHHRTGYEITVSQMKNKSYYLSRIYANQRGRLDRMLHQKLYENQYA